MKTWYSYCPEDGMTLHGSEEEARRAAEAALEGYRDDAMQGEWHPDMHMLSWGLLVPFQEARQVDVRNDENSEYDYTCDYALGTVRPDAEDRVFLRQEELREQRLRAGGFEPVSDEQRSENIFVNLGFVK
jgi:hypothetical protein